MPDQGSIAQAALSLLAGGWDKLTPAALAKKLKAKPGAVPDQTQILRALIDTADAAMMAERVDSADTPKDRLLGVMMARIDHLQTHRAAYEHILAHLESNPAQAASLLPTLHHSMQKALQQAKLETSAPIHALQAAGLLGIYAWTLKAWRQDMRADLPATMRALDQTLSRADWLMQRLAGRGVF